MVLCWWAARRGAAAMLFSAGAFDGLADFLHILAEAGDGIAAGQDEGSDGDGEQGFHDVGTKVKTGEDKGRGAGSPARPASAAWLTQRANVDKVAGDTGGRRHGGRDQVGSST